MCTYCTDRCTIFSIFHDLMFESDAKELRECIHDAILMMTMILIMMMTMMLIMLIMMMMIMMMIMMMYLVTLGGGAVWFGGGAWLGGGTVNLCGTIVGGGT